VVHGSEAQKGASPGRSTVIGDKQSPASLPRTQARVGTTRLGHEILFDRARIPSLSSSVNCTPSLPHTQSYPNHLRSAKAFSNDENSVSGPAALDRRLESISTSAQETPSLFASSFRETKTFGLFT
jgi:hypothetical protein